MFHEKQSGGQCKKHTVNNAYGGVVVDAKQFAQTAKLFDKLNLADKATASGHDTVNMYRETSSAFVLRVLNRMPSLTLSTSEMRDEKLSISDMHKHACAAMQYTRTHIWAYRKIRGTWMNVDSMRTPRAHKPGQVTYVFKTPPPFLVRLLKSTHTNVRLMALNNLATFKLISSKAYRQLEMLARSSADVEELSRFT